MGAFVVGVTVGAVICGGTGYYYPPYYYHPPYGYPIYYPHPPASARKSVPKAAGRPAPARSNGLRATPGLQGKPAILRV